MDLWDDQFELLVKGDFRALARTISLLENEVTGYENFLKRLSASATKIVGITGAPGTGKSSITDTLIGEIIKDKKKAGVLCVDPSSPFNKGALLGDRIRMSEWYNHPDVFIRSLANRGSLGGLHPKIIEISDVMKAAGFDYIIIETVGVGQSEVDIASLADITVVVLVPESGDAIQSMKAGLMEIADIFLVNKSDRPDADKFYHNLSKMIAPAFRSSEKKVPILKTIATQKEGIGKLYETIVEMMSLLSGETKADLLFEKVWSIMQDRKMKDINKVKLRQAILDAATSENFNLYQFAEDYLRTH